MSFPRGFSNQSSSSNTDMQIENSDNEGYGDIESLPDETPTPPAKPTLKVDDLVINSRNIIHTPTNQIMALIHHRIGQYQFLCVTNSQDRHKYNLELNDLIKLAKAKYIDISKKQLELQACLDAVELLRSPDRGNYDLTIPRVKKLLNKLAEDNPSRALLNVIYNNMNNAMNLNSISMQDEEKSPPTSSPAPSPQPITPIQSALPNVHFARTLFLNSFKEALNQEMHTKSIYDFCLLIAANFEDPNNDSIGVQCKDQTILTQLKQCAIPFRHFAMQLKFGTNKSHAELKQELLEMINQSYLAMHDIDPERSHLRYSQLARFIIKRSPNRFILIALRLGIIELHSAEENQPLTQQNQNASEQKYIPNQLPFKLADCNSTTELYKHHDELLFAILLEEKQLAKINNLKLHNPTLLTTAKLLLACAINISDYVNSQKKRTLNFFVEDNLPLLRRAAYYFNRINMLGRQINLDLHPQHKFIRLEILLKIHQLDAENKTENLMNMMYYIDQHGLARSPNASIKEKALLATCNAIQAASNEKANENSAKPF